MENTAISKVTDSSGAEGQGRAQAAQAGVGERTLVTAPADTTVVRQGERQIVKQKDHPKKRGPVEFCYT